MSDAVTNAEVEDVLSSIRRLVSEDRRPVIRPKADAPSEDKLVLTPSLRVSNDAPLVDAYRKPEPVKPTEWDDEQAAVEDDLVGGDALDTGFGAADDDSMHNPSVDGGQDDQALFHDLDELEDEGLIRDAMSDRSADRDAVDRQTETLRDTDRPNTVSSITARAGMLNLGASELVESKSAPGGSDLLSAKIAALETAIGRIPGGWDAEEPETPKFSVPEPLAMAWEDDVERDATGAPILASRKPDPKQPPLRQVEAPVETASYADADAFEDKDASEVQEDLKALGGEEYFDEEMLRDLVGEIVRAELQGALGERITRNVRKLVRREIHRALTSQELE